MRIKTLLSEYQTLLDNDVSVQGWVQTARPQKEYMFVKLNDGSCVEGIQLIYSGTCGNIIAGTSLKATGKLVASPAQGQLVEIIVNEIEIMGTSSDKNPISKTKMNLEYLRNYSHLRARTSTFGSVFRIKSAISQATHAFFKEEGYFHLDPNIITTNECEGGAGVFQLTEYNISDLSKLPVLSDKKSFDWTKDHFDRPVFLTVSSQLQLEALACALGSVYTMNKSFRSEHSLTRKHLSEFTHLEIETCFVELSDLMDIAEKFIKFIADILLKESLNEIRNLGKFVSVGLEERISTIRDCKFHRITYDEAITLANGSITYGEDLSSEVETTLTNLLGGPVFVYNWPISIKSFYMKQDQLRPGICNNFDLLMPYKIGELIGGSLREENLEKLTGMMEQKGVSTMNFYTDLRKFGTVPHGGFGLGFDRLTMLFTGMENIKDTIPFPISYKNCDY